ncbi:hypothetical protein [Catenuloplanes indicus]|uniref:Uncharacterized protein n=1 Tax=Catenuloplanes indicus TaxID=137267 RepID=A0AAE3W989_9ACTN|nr:hypothetical protein [Catenuloplanes indicus]MDQ0371645.1 hypothetical protein [Catenuloplanes indicus]
MKFIDTGKARITEVRQHGVALLGWISVFVGATGGALAADTWIGDTLRWILGITPWDTYVYVLTAVAGIGIIILDLIKDGVPNHPMVLLAIAVPSITKGAANIVGGKLYNHVNDFYAWLKENIGGNIADWIGPELGATAIALACFTLAILLSLAVLARQRTTGVATGMVGARR